MPRLTMVTFVTGSHLGRTRCTTAWPPSWNAMISFSSSVMSRLRRSGPAITRSIASLNSSVPTDFLFRAGARDAAHAGRGPVQVEEDAWVAFPQGARTVRTDRSRRRPAHVPAHLHRKLPEIVERLTPGTTLTIFIPSIGKAFGADGEVPFLPRRTPRRLRRDRSAS